MKRNGNMNKLPYDLSSNSVGLLGKKKRFTMSYGSIAFGYSQGETVYVEKVAKDLSPKLLAEMEVELAIKVRDFWAKTSDDTIVRLYGHLRGLMVDKNGIYRYTQGTLVSLG